MNDQRIIDLYTKENKSTYEIAELLNTYPNKIRRVLCKHGVHIKTKSEAQKNALLNGVAKIPTQGTHRTEEEKLKISRGLKKSWESLDEAEYKERVDAARARWYNMSESDKDKMLSQAIQAVRIAGKEGSKLEKFLYKELTAIGYKIDYHKKQLIANENLEIDIYIPSVKTVIEIDGPSHFLPIWGEEKLQKQIRADSHKTGLILSKGCAIIRVKNLSDSVSLGTKEDLKNQIIALLQTFESQFPDKSERYIELEI